MLVFESSALKLVTLRKKFGSPDKFICQFQILIQYFQTINASLYQPLLSDLFGQPPDTLNSLDSADNNSTFNACKSDVTSSTNRFSSLLLSINKFWTALDSAPLVQLFRTREVDAQMKALGFGGQSTASGDFGAVEEAYRDEYARFLDKIVESIGGEEDSNGSLFMQEGV